MRVQAIISYDGSAYFGMQKQPHKQTIQDRIEIALSSLNIAPHINYSGRTDTGVHALNQSIDFEIPHYWYNLEKLKSKLNSILIPQRIMIKIIRKVDDNFHSRFMATKRSYRYLITDKLTPFNINYTFYKKNLNIEKMQNGANLFVGEHNFEYFKKNGSEIKDSIRKIYDFKITTFKNYVIMRVLANGFLRSQIRFMVGSLIMLSDNLINFRDIELQLSMEQKKNLIIAPSSGLYFERSYYDR